MGTRPSTEDEAVHLTSPPSGAPRTTNCRGPQQLNVLQICEPLCRCHPIVPAHDTTSRPPRYRAPTFAASPIPLDNVPRLAQRQSIPE